jgi:hypothetical protein
MTLTLVRFGQQPSQFKEKNILAIILRMRKIIVNPKRDLLLFIVIYVFKKFI